ncbi:MAG: hypothetical protein J3K34DRAFT_215651 [Monoraphidium minutum]|nr:MAG: hypothetical protein J3K34DRAFT_215651 [Monoraphidium minutum]
MRQSADSGGAPDGEPLAEATVFKGTTLPHISVQRRLQLYPSGLATLNDKDREKPGGAAAKFWPLHRRCGLEPPDAAGIKAHERHLRRAGPLRAVASYARDKNVLKLYCFRVEWPDKHAPSHGSVVELGFDTLTAAREWHGLISAQLQARPMRAPLSARGGRGLGGARRCAALGCDPFRTDH